MKISAFLSIITAVASADSVRQENRELLSLNDAISWLNTICEQYAGEPCWSTAGHRQLDETEFSFNSQDLIDANPDKQDTIKHVGNARSDKFGDDLGYWISAENSGNDGVEWRKFTGVDNKNLNYVKIVGDGNLGALVFSVGQSEPIYKYDEYLKDMQLKGYSPIYVLEHRGQGTSDRLINGNSYKNHVRSSTHFIDDFSMFVDIVMNDLGSSFDKPKYLACHSMGCAIAFTHLMEEVKYKNQNTFNAVVANAPLIKADTSPFPYDIATLIGATMVNFGIGEWFAPTKGKTFEEDWNNAAYSATGSSVNSVNRWVRYRDTCVRYRNEIVGEDRHEGLCLGGVTGQMAKEFFDLYDEFEAFNAMDDLKISTPVLIQVAGDVSGSDGLVMNPETVNFAERSIDNVHQTNYEQSTHNIWFQGDDIRQPAMDEADTFFAQHTAFTPFQDFCPDRLAKGEQCNRHMRLKFWQADDGDDRCCGTCVFSHQQDEGSSWWNTYTYNYYTCQ